MPLNLSYKKFSRIDATWSTPNSKYRSRHGNGVIPESATACPFFDHFNSDRIGFGDVAFLTLTHVCSQRPIAQQDVVLVIEFEASALQVSRTFIKDDV